VFSGIVQDVGRVAASERRGGDLRLVIAPQRLDLSATRVGDSLCVQGCCLTVAELAGRTFAADVSRETLAVTTLGDLVVGSSVNLEPALRVGDALGGHLVSGHVDGVARIAGARPEARSLRLTIDAPPQLGSFLAPKGSVAVDGVSLTINEVQGASFGVNIIPHTQTGTTLGSLTVGARVNLEVDLIARYVARLLQGFTNPQSGVE
jgi:riboflavin synthase